MAEWKSTYFLEGNADDLIKAFKAGADATEKLGKEAEKTGDKLEKAGKKGKKAAKALSPLEKGLKKVSTATTGVTTGQSLMRGEFMNVAKAAPMLLNPIGLISVAIGAMVVAAGAAVIALGAMGAGLIATVLAADELNEELKKFEDLEGFEPIDPDALAAIETVNAAVEAMGVIFDRLKVALAAEVAPALEKTALIMVKLGLVAIDTFTTFADGKDVLVEFATYLGGAFVKSLARPITQIANFYDGLGLLTIALGQKELGEKFRNVKRDVDDLADAIARPVVEGVFNAASDGLEKIGSATGNYDERAAALLGTLDDLDPKLKKQGKTVKELLKAWEAVATQIEMGATAIDKIAQSNRYWLTEEDKLFDAYNAKIAQLGEIEIQTKKNLALIDEEIDKAKKLGLSTEELTEAQREGGLSLIRIEQQRLASIAALADGLEKLDTSQEEHLAMVGDVASKYEDAFGAAIDFVLMQNEVLTKSQRNMLLTLYRLQQAAAITSIIIDTAEGIMKYAKMGPLGIAGAVAIGALGATQLAMVAATPPPFHTGGIIPDGAGLASVLPGESVLTREATAKLGADGVRDLNSGMGSPTLVIEQVYKHKIFDSFVQDNINKGGPLASAIRGTSRVGRT